MCWLLWLYIYGKAALHCAMERKTHTHTQQEPRKRKEDYKFTMHTDLMFALLFFCYMRPLNESVLWFKLRITFQEGFFSFHWELQITLYKGEIEGCCKNEFMSLDNSRCNVLLTALLKVAILFVCKQHGLIWYLAFCADSGNNIFVKVMLLLRWG